MFERPPLPPPSYRNFHEETLLGWFWLRSTYDIKKEAEGKGIALWRDNTDDREKKKKKKLILVEG